MTEQGVAVVGYACRTPAAHSVDELWQLVAAGKDVVTRAATNIGATSGDRVHAYGVLDGFEAFDEEFFGYSPREAVDIDPQQRLLLECAVEALEDAGVRLAGLDSEVGAYLSTGLSGYLLNTWTGGAGGAEDLPALLGGDGHYAATRIAYKLGLTGPAVAIGSACSSSLLSIHLAAQAIAGGECDVALAGGMDVEFPQPMSYLYQEGGILARDGVCRPFDRNASGTVFGSGGGVVVLALPEVARANGWPIKAVLLGSAANNDGAKKASFTAPRGSRQRDVVELALSAAGVSPDRVGYVECHGTGTTLGDSTELTALRQVFGELPAIGSVKGNIGHLRVGAGVVGFVKACEVARRGVVPPAANLADPVEEAATRTTLRGDVVGVSSFGFGGTNVHAVLTGGVDAESTVDSYPVVLKVSSAGPESCVATARGLASLPASVADLAFTLDRGRDDRAYRYAVVAGDRAAAAAGLAAPGENVVEGWAGEPTRLVFTLPGQGGDVLPLLKAFHRWEPVFTETADRLWALVPGGSLDDVIAGAALERPAAHALPVVVSLALAAQLEARGVRPDLVAGYSLGEYAAAAVAGAMSPEDAVRLVVERALLLAAAPAGDMVVVQGEVDLPAAITLAPDRRVLAVLEGDLPALRDRLGGLQFRELGVGVPYHSPALAELAPELARAAAAYPHATSDRLVLTSDASFGPDYWAAHLAAPIDFTRVAALVGATHSFTPCTVVDFGLDGALSRAVVAGEDIAAVRLFHASGDPRETYLRALATLWVNGHPVDLSTADGRLISLPPRQFDRRRHLKEPGTRPQSTRRTVRRELSVENWAYHPSWRLRRRPHALTEVRGERWLVFSTDSTLLQGLTDLGVDVVEVPDVRGEEQVKAFVGGLGLRERPISRIVHMWCADELADVGTFEAMNDEMAKGFYPLLYAIQQISVDQGASPVQLDVVARGIHPVGADQSAVVPERALLLGPALVVPQDMPFVTARTIDVTGLADVAAEVLVELRCGTEDRAVAFSAGQRWARSYERATLPVLGDERPLRLKDRGVYLITGGLGGIGMTLAEYLVRTCRARLVLTALEAVPDPAYWEGGRSDLPADPVLAERVVRVRKLVSLGGEVVAARCDAADRDETAALIAAVDERFGQLDGVVHAAGVFETQRAFRGLEDTGQEDCERRLRPKVDGTLVLAECLRGRRLDFVLMQSSLSAQLGGLGFYAYTAGNAYMDAFAERFRDDDIPWMSVNWDGWIFRERDDDAPAGSVVSPSFASPDFGVVAEIAVRPSEGAEIYGRLMNLVEPQQILISTADFGARYEQWVRQPLPVTSGVTEIVGDSVESAIASVWREVLGVAEVGPDSNFFALGGDSLLGVSLAYRLGQVFGVVLSVITMFDRPTVAAMAEEIRKLGGRLPLGEES